MKSFFSRSRFLSYLLLLSLVSVSYQNCGPINRMNVQTPERIKDPLNKALGDVEKSYSAEDTLRTRADYCFKATDNQDLRFEVFQQAGLPLITDNGVFSVKEDYPYYPASSFAPSQKSASLHLAAPTYWPQLRETLRELRFYLGESMLCEYSVPRLLEQFKTKGKSLREYA